MKTIWPEVEDHIVAEQSWLTLASRVFDEHGEVTLVCCTDEEWVTKTIMQYNGQQGAHGYYNFPEIRQEPTPRLSSATALRDAVKAGDREAFSDAAGVSADTPVAGKPFFDLVAEYLLPYQNAPKKVAKKRDLSEGIPLKFNTVELSESQIHNYVKEWYSLYHIDRPHSKSVANIRRLVGKKLAESKEVETIATFIDMIKSVDYPKTIKIGDHFAVLSFEIVFAWKEINATGFVTPKEVVDIKLNNNGTINYITFADGDRYPRLTPATYQGKPIEQTAYFTDESSAESTLTALTLKVPSDWELDVSGVRRGVAEDTEQKFEVTYDIYGNNKEKPLYTNTRTVRATSEQEAINLLRRFVGGTNYRVKKKDTELPETEVSEGWKGKAGAAALAAATAVGIGMSPKLTVDGVTYDKAISAPPEDAKTVTKDGKRYKVWQSSPLKQRPGGGKYNLYKQIDESAWPFDYLLETADTKSREFQWTDYDGMSMSDRMMVAETFFSKNSNLFETNEQHSVDYFFSLKPYAPALKEGTPYIAALLGMVNDRVVPLQAVEICTIVSKTGSEYKVRLSDGTITMFPNEYISKNMVAETFFFKDIDSYDQFRAAIFLKFSVDLVPQDQIKGIELLSDDISEEAAGVGVIANKKQAKDPRYSMSLTKDVRPGEVERSLKKLRLR